MRLARKLLLGAVLLLVLADVLLIVSGRALLVHAYDEQMVTMEGDVVLPATSERRGPRYSPPYTLRTCVYWTGLRLSYRPLVGADRCAWLG